MKYRIVADSAANVYVEDKVSFAYAPLKIVAGDTTWVDDRELDVAGMVDALKVYKGKTGTACPSVGDWLEAFGDAEYVVGVCMTGTLSGTYNSAMLAKRDYEEAHPGRKVFILDSLSAGPEEQLIIEKMEEFILAGKTFEEIESMITEYVKRTHLLFSLESLTNLVNNGRVSPIIAAAAGVLGMRIVGKASDQGELQQLHKCRGEKKAVITIYKEMIEHGYTGGKVRVAHCYNEEMASVLKEKIVADYPEADVQILSTGGLCSYYAEKGGLLIGFEG